MLLYDYWRSSAAYRVRLALNFEPGDQKHGDDHQRDDLPHLAHGAGHK
jgi:hypothetical protein